MQISNLGPTCPKTLVVLKLKYLALFQHLVNTYIASINIKTCTATTYFLSEVKKMFFNILIMPKVQDLIWRPLVILPRVKLCVNLNLCKLHTEAQHAHRHVLAQTHIHILECLHAYAHTCTYVCICRCTCVHTHTWLYACMHIYICAYENVYMYKFYVYACIYYLLRSKKRKGI